MPCILVLSSSGGIVGFVVFKVECEGENQCSRGSVIFTVFFDFNRCENFECVLLVTEGVGESSEPVVCSLAAAVAVWGDGKA